MVIQTKQHVKNSVNNLDNDSSYNDNTNDSTYCPTEPTIYTLETNVPLNAAFQRLTLPSDMDASTKTPNEYKINYADTIDYEDSSTLNNTLDDYMNTNIDAISVGTEEPLNEVMKKKLRKRDVAKHVIDNNEDDATMDAFTIGTEEPLTQVRTRKRVLSRIHNALLSKRSRRNKYNTNYAEDTDTEYSLNASTVTFHSSIQKKRQNSAKKDVILQGKVCDYNLKSAKEIPIEDIKIEFEGIDLDNTRKDPEFNAQCEDSITTSQRSITKIAEEAGVGLVVQNRRLYSKKESGQFTKNLNIQSQRCKGTKKSTKSSSRKNTFSASKQIKTLNNIKDVLMHFGMP